MKACDRYGKMAANSLGLIFSVHGTDEKLFIDMTQYYENLEMLFTIANEVLDK